MTYILFISNPPSLRDAWDRIHATVDSCRDWRPPLTKSEIAHIVYESKRGGNVFLRCTFRAVMSYEYKKPSFIDRFLRMILFWRKPK